MFTFNDCTYRRFPCPITLLWLESAGASGYRIYVAPSTGTEWEYVGERTRVPVELKCSTTDQTLLAEVDATSRTAEVDVRREWTDQHWCVILTAFNDVGESEPNIDYLILDSR